MLVTSSAHSATWDADGGNMDLQTWLVLARGGAYAAALAASAAKVEGADAEGGTAGARRQAADSGAAKKGAPVTMAQALLEDLQRQQERAAAGQGAGMSGMGAGEASPPSTPALARRRRTSLAGPDGLLSSSAEVNPQEFGEDGSWWTRRYALHLRTDLEDDLLSERSDESEVGSWGRKDAF
jgi:hypothetical protein